jgi:tRNA threonylcarbamoyladenosine biosynthesis protein TsaB
MQGPVLALDTSTSVGSVAVGADGLILAEMTLRVGAGSSSLLLPAIDEVVRIAGFRAADLVGIVVGGGPGSFTGLRIAAATAKGLVHTLGVPLWSYSGLLATAAGSWQGDAAVCALFDARRRDVFAACYRFADDGVETLLGPSALAVESLVEQADGWGDAVVFTGEAALLYRAELAAVRGSRVAPVHLTQPRAAALLWLQTMVPAAGRVEDPARWEPEYARESGAERIAAARLRSDGGA